MQSIQLTPEQQAVLKEAVPPSQIPKGGRIVRIRAGAGSGKTTTLLHLARACGSQGHSKVTYLTFGREASKDGCEKLLPVMPQGVFLQGKTLHACAMQELNAFRNYYSHGNDSDNKSGNFGTLFDETKIKKFIEREFNHEINDFLKEAYKNLREKAEKETSPYKRRLVLQRKKGILKRYVIYFVYSTLRKFCLSSMSEQEFRQAPSMTGTPNQPLDARHYFPATLFHRDETKYISMGFTHAYASPHAPDWYVHLAIQAWDLFNNNNFNKYTKRRIHSSNSGNHLIRSYDFEMKRAQLHKLEIPGTVILIDEVQDADACQLDWATTQAELYGKLVFLVGDTAQSIYSFRGAKPTVLNALKSTHHTPVVDYTLTTSFRFGCKIANIANLVLFAKKKSPQTVTKKGKQIWDPYMLTGAGNPNGVVTSDQLSLSCLEEPVTIIARTNAELLFQAVSLLGVKPVGENKSKENDHIEKTNGQDSVPSKIPRFHLQGGKSSGKNGGVKEWEMTMDMIKELYLLWDATKEEDGKGKDSDKIESTVYTFSQKKTIKLSPRIFPEFDGEVDLTWNSFLSHVSDFHLSKYSRAITTVTALRGATLTAVDKFQRLVMDRPCDAKDADVILTTCHKAKGLEWNRVQVCNDFIEIRDVERYFHAQPQNCFTPRKQVANERIQASPMKRQRMMQEAEDGKEDAQQECWYQFSLPEWGDDVNLLYVACTRAKKVLSIPHKLRTLLRDFDKVQRIMQKAHQQQENKDSDDFSELLGEWGDAFGRKQDSVDLDLVKCLHKDLVEPFRQQMEPWIGTDPNGLFFSMVHSSVPPEDEPERSEAVGSSSVRSGKQESEASALPQNNCAITLPVIPDIINECNGNRHSFVPSDLKPAKLCPPI